MDSFPNPTAARTAFLTVSLAMAHALPAQLVDDNDNGLSDVWEAAHGGTFVPGEDQDGDGFTNLQEAACGTDPANSASFPFIREVRPDAPDEITNIWPTVAGIRYRTLVSTDMLTWQPVGTPVIGNGADVSQTLEMSATMLTGDAERSRWNEFSGGIPRVKQYVSDGSPVAGLTGKLSRLKIAQSEPDENSYGQWIHGWIIPTETGTHTFWLASDDGSELWLSPDRNSSGKQLVASVQTWTSPGQWDKFPSQKSAAIPLEAGRPYYFEIFHTEGTGGDHFEIAWTQPGDADGTRATITSENLSTSANSLEEISENSGGLFFRLEASQVDSDGDGVSDYEESLLGLNPALSTSTPRLADLESARRSLASPSTVNVGVATARAYEAGGIAAEFVVFRTGGIGPITVPFSLSGSATPGADFASTSGTVRFPAGARSVRIPIVPLIDEEIEPAETVTLTLASGNGFELGSPQEATVSIDDSPDVLHIAQLRTSRENISAGSGIAAIRRDGNSLASVLSLSFGGLGGAEISAEIFHSRNGLGGPTVFTFPTGQVQSVSWDFSPAGGMSREQILTALDSGELWVRINTSAAAGAEVTGQLLKTPAWQTPPATSPPPPAPALASTTAETARFLTQATFGPTEASLATLSGHSYEQWIDSQLALPASLHHPGYIARRDQLVARNGNDGWQGPRNEIWWQRALTAPGPAPPTDGLRTQPDFRHLTVRRTRWQPRGGHSLLRYVAGKLLRQLPGSFGKGDSQSGHGHLPEHDSESQTGSAHRPRAG